MLVVAAAGRAVGEHQGGLAAAPGPARPLGVVGGGGRDVAHVHDVQVGDVHAQLHGGRAEQHGQLCLAELLLALLALGGGHLGGVLSGLHPGRVRGQIPIQLDEEPVGLEAALGGVRGGQVVVAAAGSGPGPPAQRGGRDLIAGVAVAVVADDGQQAVAAEPVHHRGDDRLGVLQEEPAVGPAPAAGAAQHAGSAQELAVGAAGRQEHPVPVVSAAAAGQHLAGLFQAAVVGVQRPGAGQVLIAAPLQTLLLAAVQHVHPQHQVGAQPVEQGPQDSLPGVPVGLAEGGGAVASGPEGGVVEQVGQVLVVDLQQAGLLQVGLGHPPAPLQVAVQPVGQHVAQGPVDGAAGRSGEVGLAGVGLPRQRQLVEHPPGQLVVGESGRACGARGSVQRGPQHRHLHEVVEVGGLQRGVLAVVGERQQLAGLGAQRPRLPEAPDGGQRHDGGGGGPAPGAQLGQPAEVGAPGVGVRHPAVEAEPERGRDPVSRDRGPEPAAEARTRTRGPAGRLFAGVLAVEFGGPAQRPVGPDCPGGGHLVAAGGPEGAVVVQPVLGQPLACFLGVVGPGVVGADVKEPGGVARLVVAVPVAQIPTLQLRPGGRRHSLDHVVVLAALPAERQREIRPAPVRVPGHEALLLQGHGPHPGRLGGGPGGVAPAQELVQAEREHRHPGGGVLDLLAGHQLGPDRLGARLLIEPGLFRQAAGSAVGAFHGQRLGPLQAPVGVGHPEGGLDPRRQRIGLEPAGVGRGGAGVVDPLDQPGPLPFGSGGGSGGAAERLADHVVGRNFVAEQLRGHGGEVGLALGGAALAGQGGRRSHAQQPRAASPAGPGRGLADPAHQHGHV